MKNINRFQKHLAKHNSVVPKKNTSLSVVRTNAFSHLNHHNNNLNIKKAVNHTLSFNFNHPKSFFHSKIMSKNTHMITPVPKINRSINIYSKDLPKSTSNIFLSSLQKAGFSSRYTEEELAQFPKSQRDIELRDDVPVDVPKGIRVFKGKKGFWIIPKELAKPYKEYPKEDPRTGWKTGDKRVGLIGRKAGMISVEDEWGQVFAATILHVPGCVVTQTKTMENDGINAMQVGIGTAKLKHLLRAQQGHFAKFDIEPKRWMKQFEVSETALLPVGTPLSIRHFVPWQHVDIQSTTRGKGFAGGMKRWGFSGNRASHGASLSHRGLGSTGARTNPGKVWKGKKMPGQMGGRSCTVVNLRIHQLNLHEECIVLRGHIPGARGTLVKIWDSRKYIWEHPPPYPTFVPEEGEVLPDHGILRSPSPRPNGWTENLSDRNDTWAFEGHEDESEAWVNLARYQSGYTSAQRHVSKK